jgi:hypothetical protein
MISGPRLLTRIGLFSALVYVLSWGTTFLPNVNLIFFVVFTAGMLWGLVPGILVGVVGMGLWTTFNPFGPALLPIMLAQVLGAAASGTVGALFARHQLVGKSGAVLLASLLTAATLCTALFFIPLSLVDAWLFQPFWPRFVGGLLWALISLGSNLLIFPLLFPAARHLYLKECALP